MNPVTGFVTYFILWWLVFLAALPFGVRGQWEDGEISHGSEPGAPVHPMLWKKALWTTVIAAAFWAALYLVITLNLLDLADLPGPNSYWE